ncbi:gorasp2-prov protein [Besnoitia besnoiti]|uniref:Gorasp2-prov protein n=1 Tax=Besnoitia besnoiti TaxID=94643 RepID=A0A2A9MIQ5_BESBE|nr:gorasp2-prov protein [Besnoitia besnoiti]PFH37865.1 gorasp2-prov protein [Besnoitia besnoiti]
MGAGQSLDQRAALAAGEKAKGGAYRVMKIQRGSPAEAAGLEIFFDFITQIDDVPLTSPTEETLQAFFAKVNQPNRPEPVQLVVFNARMRSFRTVTLVPAALLPPASRANRAVSSSIFSLGLSVSFADVSNVMSEGVRVLAVAPNSPAAHAGLVATQDWILADNQGVFRDLDDLVESVSASLKRHMQIFVFNAASETIREVFIVPNNDWGGEGSLGCELGSGYLHRLPFSRRALAGVTTSESHADLTASPSPRASCPSADPRVCSPARPSSPGAVEGEEPAAPVSPCGPERPTSQRDAKEGASAGPQGERDAERACAAVRKKERDDCLLLKEASEQDGRVSRDGKEEVYILDSDGAPVLLTEGVEFNDAYPPYAHAFDDGEDEVWDLVCPYRDEGDEFGAAGADFACRPSASSLQPSGYFLYPVTNSPLKETSFPLCDDRDGYAAHNGRSAVAGSSVPFPFALANAQGRSRGRRDSDFDETSSYFAYDLPYAAAMARHTSAVFTGPPQAGEVVSSSSLH